MIRSSGVGGFESRSAPVASSRLTDAVAAALAIGSLSLCLIVTLTVFSIKVSDGDADSGVAQNYFSRPFAIFARQRAMIRIAIGQR